MQTMRFIVICALSLLVAGCSGAPLAHSHDSSDSLARAVLTAIERRDIDALQALAIDRAEFADHVWPELPAARPERNLSVGYVWGDLNQKSNVTLKHTLSAHGGTHYELDSIRFLGDSTSYDRFVVHRESELTVKDSSGTARQIRLFGSVLEKDGRYKVFSYVIDD
jgi:hypothetical protein